MDAPVEFPNLLTRVSCLYGQTYEQSRDAFSAIVGELQMALKTALSQGPSTEGTGPFFLTKPHPLSQPFSPHVLACSLQQMASTLRFFNIDAERSPQESLSEWTLGTLETVVTSFLHREQLVNQLPEAALWDLRGAHYISSGYSRTVSGEPELGRVRQGVLFAGNNVLASLLTSPLHLKGHDSTILLDGCYDIVAEKKEVVKIGDIGRKPVHASGSIHGDGWVYVDRGSTWQGTIQADHLSLRGNDALRGTADCNSLSLKDIRSPLSVRSAGALTFNGGGRTGSGVHLSGGALSVQGDGTNIDAHRISFEDCPQVTVDAPFVHLRSFSPNATLVIDGPMTLDKHVHRSRWGKTDAYHGTVHVRANVPSRYTLFQHRRPDVQFVFPHPIEVLSRLSETGYRITASRVDWTFDSTRNHYVRLDRTVPIPDGVQDYFDIKRHEARNGKDLLYVLKSKNPTRL